MFNGFVPGNGMADIGTLDVSPRDARINETDRQKGQ